MSLIEQVCSISRSYAFPPLMKVRTQGYIKAYIMHAKRLLVLQKGEAAGFPKLSSVNM